MRFVLRGIFGPLSRTLISGASAASISIPSSSPKPGFRFTLGVLAPWTQMSNDFSIFTESNGFDRLTDTRLPKQRPLDKPRSKRASLRPPGLYAWAQYEPGHPVQPNNPNEGSVKRRKEKKRIAQRKAFIKAEAKKRKAQLQEAKRKKNMKRVERKMAAVAREREWGQRLAELQRLEEEKKKSMV